MVSINGFKNTSLWMYCFLFFLRVYSSLSLSSIPNYYGLVTIMAYLLYQRTIFFQYKTNKNTTNQQLYTTKIYSLSLLKARSSILRCQLGCALSEVSRRGSFLSLPNFWGLLTVLGIPWLTDIFLQSLPLLQHGLLPVCLL